MPALIAVLWAAFYAMIGSVVGRVLVSLTLGMFEFAGANYLLGKIKVLIVQNFTGVGSLILGVLSTAKVDVCINIIFSAILIRFLLNGMNSASGSIKKMGFK